MMNHFFYKAMDAQGRLSRGWQDANDPADLDRRLRNAGLQLIRFRPSPFAPRPSQVKPQELITLFLTLEQLEKSGVPLLDALASIRDSLDGRLKTTIADLLEEVSNGHPLSLAMASHPSIFDSVCTSLIKAGEESGRLHEVFGQLAESAKWQDELTTHTRNLLLYPTFVAVTVLTVTAFLLVWLVPQLSVILLSLGQPIPWQTHWLLAASHLLRQYWPVIPVIALVLLAIEKSPLMQRESWQLRLDGWRLRSWLIGNILRKLILARFANTFAMLYSSGIGVLDSLRLCRTLSGNRVIAHGLAQVAEDVESGQPLTRSFQRAGLFPPLVLQMLKVGETTGELDRALLNVSYFYTREVQDSIRRIQTLLEPALTVFFGLMLGWIMLAVLLPVYDIISQVKLR